MAEMLLINPRARKRTRRVAAKRRPATRRRNPVAALTHVPAKRRRRRNPIGLSRVSHAVRRAGKRRRNPIASGDISAMLKAALIGGAGSIAVDVIMGQVNNFLPASMQRNVNSIGVGDAVKVGLTIALGELLKKSTGGMSVKMASGALAVQARDLMSAFIPTGMAIGYASPARVITGSNRVGPNMSRIAAYQGAGSTPLLGAYTTPGRSPMLNGARQREGVMLK